MMEEEEEESLVPSANIVEENEPKKGVVMLSARQSNGSKCSVWKCIGVLYGGWWLFME